MSIWDEIDTKSKSVWDEIDTENEPVYKDKYGKIIPPKPRNPELYKTPEMSIPEMLSADVLGDKLIRTAKEEIPSLFRKASIKLSDLQKRHPIFQPITEPLSKAAKGVATVSDFIIPEDIQSAREQLFTGVGAAANKVVQPAVKTSEELLQETAKTKSGQKLLQDSLDFVDNTIAHLNKPNGKLQDFEELLTKPETIEIKGFNTNNLTEKAKNLYETIVKIDPSIRNSPEKILSEISKTFSRSLKRTVSIEDLFDKSKLTEPFDYNKLLNEKVIKIPEVSEKYAGSINLERQKISNVAKQMELELSEESGKKVVSNDETIKGAEKIYDRFKTDPVYLQSRISMVKKGAPITKEENLAFRIVNATNHDNFIEAAKKTASGEMSVEDFRILEDKIKDMQLNVVDPVAAEYGRNLQSMNILVAKDRAFKAAAKLTKPMNERQIKEFTELAKTDFDPTAVKNFVDRLPDPKLKDYFYEYWYNSILSGIPTHIVNVGSNTLWALWQIGIHKPLATVINKVLPSKLGGKEEELFFNEIIPMWAGFTKGFKKGAVAFSQMVKTGKAIGSKFETDMGVPAWERSPNKIVRRMAPAVNMASRLLKGMDVWAKTMAYDGAAEAIADREAIKKGLKGEAATRFKTELLTKLPKEFMEEAANVADYFTFNDKPGAVTEALINLRNKIPLGRLIVPFVNTVSNITKRGLEMTPGVGITMSKGRRIADVAAKQLEGLVISSLIWNKISKGEITGAWPDNAAEREAWRREGKLPWAIKMNGKWIQYRRFEPFNTVINATNSFYNNVVKTDDKTVPERVLKFSQDIAENLIDSTYFSSIQTLLDKNTKWKGSLERGLASMIPFNGFMRSINGAVESLVEGYKEGGVKGALFGENRKLREANTLIGAGAQVIPGAYGAQEPKIDVWGNDVTIPGNFFRQWLPYKWSKETDDPVEKELMRLEFYPSLPGKKGTIEDVKYELNDDEYKFFVKKFGKMGYDIVNKIITSPGYENLSKKAKIETIDKVITKVKRGALSMAKGKKAIEKMEDIKTEAQKWGQKE